MNEAYTAVIVRGERWRDGDESEPYEAPWARECVVFARTLESSETGENFAEVLISPDGIHWVAEGSKCPIPKVPGEVGFVKLSNFGHFLKLRAICSHASSRTVMITLALKG